MDYIIAGLGNPGERYTFTRHNAGFLAIDYLAQTFNTKVDRINFKGLVGSFEYAGKKVLLLKPMTYMNASGDSIIEAVNFYKIKPEKLIVIYDDIAFDVGVVKMRKKGSDGGHNGMKSIIQRLGTEEFPRIRIGIGIPKEDMIKYVLSEFEDDEKQKVFRAIEKAAQGIKILLESGIDRAMNYINGDVVV
ncbi:aminoacyl-tRNA hydrolase [Caldicellulosiruptor naganoensis]|uniref:Peptidyl-tRNA hydrolase n=1 Tax=Caldicellulosiruptor naganoensis TaxID=29324 RepID=A0ABY7BKY9_9FIRM|nr:aminoacyl-tRNA hydrolase [Caldicellulosiruptor naganoensis]WAM32049.1 aminoacyl-tRNA hydrolase [Caldicellulosiruptor naganoensis]